MIQGPILGYARISKDDENLGRGVARQSDDIQAEATRRGLTPADTLIDNDAGASRWSHKTRPNYALLLAAIEAGSCTTVIVYNLDRLLRQPRELEHLIDLTESRGLSIISLQGLVDLSTSDGRFMARILVAKAEKEVQDARDRTRRALLEKARRGEPGSGTRPFGFLDDRVTHHPTEAPVIREMAERALTDSLGSIATWLNDTGVPSVTGKPWRRGTVKTILTSPRVVGQRQHLGERYEAVWDPIIDESTQSAIAARFTPRREYDRAFHQRRSAPRSNWLLDLATCRDCEVRLDSSSGAGGPIYKCRECGLTINARRLEERVLEVIAPGLSHPEVARVVAGSPTSPAETAAITAELDGVNRRLEALELAMWSRGDIELAHYDLAKSQLLERKATLTAALPAPPRTPRIPRSHDTLPWAEGEWKARWDAQSAVQKNGLAALFLTRVWVARAARPMWEPGRVTMTETAAGAALLHERVDPVDPALPARRIDPEAGPRR